VRKSRVPQGRVRRQGRCSSDQINDSDRSVKDPGFEIGKWVSALAKRPRQFLGQALTSPGATPLQRATAIMRPSSSFWVPFSKPEPPAAILVSRRSGWPDQEDSLRPLECRRRIFGALPSFVGLHDKIFVKEGNIITCAGSTATIDLALHLIAMHCGRDKALQAIRHMMLLDIRPPTIPQAHFYAKMVHTNDPRIHRAAQFMEQRLDCPPSIEEIAGYVGISARQLSRLFAVHLHTTPAKFQRNLRINYAHWMLVHSTSSVTKIAVDAGFSDTAHLSRDFQKQFGQPPRAFRAAMSLNSNVRSLLGPGVATQK
jgi:AraC-like DNA-binding protein